MSTGSERRFRLQLIPTLATLALGAVFIHLGQWQAGKAELQEAQKARHAQRAPQAPRAIGGTLVTAQELADAPVTVEGEYEPADRILVDNRQEGGRPGVHVVMPLRIKGSDTRILVNRGWIGWSNGRQSLPEVTTPAGMVRISGHAVVPIVKKPFLMPEGKQDHPRLWFAPDIQRFRELHAYPVQPVLILQDAKDAADALTRNWPPPQDRSAMHRGYALQWFAMAGALLVFYLAASWRRGPRA